MKPVRCRVVKNDIEDHYKKVKKGVAPAKEVAVRTYTREVECELQAVTMKEVVSACARRDRVGRIKIRIGKAGL